MIADVPISSDKFFWGATITAHAAEGSDFDSDWWRWEQRPGRIKGGDTSEIAADHLHRFQEDLGLARKLGLNALFYSLSWARIEPRRGEFNEPVLAHYANVLRAMRRLGITPIVALQEHSLPEWFARQGAWDNPRSPEWFLEYARRVHSALAGECRHWLPHVEPMRWQRMTQAENLWPAAGGRRAFRNPGIASLATCHVAVAAYLMEQDSGNRVGLSFCACGITPDDPHSPWDLRACHRLEHFHESVFADAVRAASGGASTFNFAALSLLAPERARFAPLQLRNLLARSEPDTAEGVCQCGGALAIALERVRKWDVPILITADNATSTDPRRQCFALLNQAEAVLSARAQGTNLLGFCVRPLLDGFEWHLGFTRRAGLVHVDRESLARTPNPAAFLYQDIAQHAAIRPGAITRYCPDWQPQSREAC